MDSSLQNKSHEETNLQTKVRARKCCRLSLMESRLFQRLVPAKSQSALQKRCLAIGCKTPSQHRRQKPRKAPHTALCPFPFEILKRPFHPSFPACTHAFCYVPPSRAHFFAVKTREHQTTIR